MYLKMLGPRSHKFLCLCVNKYDNSIIEDQSTGLIYCLSTAATYIRSNVHHCSDKVEPADYIFCYIMMWGRLDIS